MFLRPIRQLRHLFLGLGVLPLMFTTEARPQADLYIKDTVQDTGQEPNPDNGPMWVSEDIWVRTTPDPNHNPEPFSESAPLWTPAPHENPEYRDTDFSTPNYVYVRVRNRGTSASNGTERLRVYFAKASTGLGWAGQWNNYVQTVGGKPVLFGDEITKPRKNAASATDAERQALAQAIVNARTTPHLLPGGVSYWHIQNSIHSNSMALGQGHGTEAFIPWHREMMNRMELLLQKVDPTVKLLYWDWTTDPANSSGVNLFTNTFMGASGRGTGGVSIGAPFMPDPSGPAVTRRLNSSTTPPAQADSTLLGATGYPAFRAALESSPNHNSAHGYIGGGGNISAPASAAQDPFFFLLHTNVDRLWAQWQRQGNTAGNLYRQIPATAYDTDSGSTGGAGNDTNIVSDMVPWDGSSSLSPWTSVGGQIKIKDSMDASVVYPPVYDTALLTVPVLQPGEAAVIQVPWYVPNPADFTSFGQDQGHFCLLARIETDSNAPFGMAVAETSDVNANTKNNNNIAWKNITVVDQFPAALKTATVFIRNVFEKEIDASLRISAPDEFGPNMFQFGRVNVRLAPELFARWKERGLAAKGVELLGGNNVGVFSSGALLESIPLKPGESFPVEVEFALPRDYKRVKGFRPKIDVLQLGSPDNKEEVVGGQRFEVDISRSVLLKKGGQWKYLDGFARPDDNWTGTDFDDREWKTGIAPFGFGRRDVATHINAGDANKKKTVSFYRHEFFADEPGFYRDLTMGLRATDGAIVYLNGTEIHRLNLPNGANVESLNATDQKRGLAEMAYYPVKVPDELLGRGKNVIAVSHHLLSAKNPSAAMDIELYANAVEQAQEPLVAFTNLRNGLQLRAGKPFSVQLDALDPDGKIVSVDVLLNGKDVARLTEQPYVFNLPPTLSGPVDLYAVATGSDGKQGSARLRVSFVDAVPPDIRLLLPQAMAVQEAGAAMVLAAEAGSPDGISHVEFLASSMERFEDAKVVATVKSSPFEAKLEGLAPGMYMISAVAVTNKGARNQSRPVHVNVGMKH